MKSRRCAVSACPSDPGSSACSGRTARESPRSCAFSQRLRDPPRGAISRSASLPSQTGLSAAGALFITALALALGVWSGTSKFFEDLYTALWYVGPMNHTPALDFTGAASDARSLKYALVYLLLGAGLLAAAFIRRHAQLRGA